jgi:hypothetical protein
MILPYLRECKNIGESFEQVWGEKNDFHYLCVDEKREEKCRLQKKKKEKKNE